MFFVLIISLYTSRVVINTLGISDYGIYNVVGSIVTFFGFLNATLASSMQRFYNYEGGINGELGHTKVYATGFWIHLLLCAIIFIILEPVGIWYINNVMVLPADRIIAAHIVFQCSLLSMLLVISQIPYTAIILAKEKMDFYTLVSIIDTFLKLFIVILLPYLPYDKLITFSVLTLIISLSNFTLNIVYAKCKFKFLRLKHLFDRLLFRQLLKFSGWNLIGVFALLMRGQGLNLLLNAFFGTIINAARGVAYQVHNAIIGFSRNINTAFAPQMTDSYSKGNYDRVCSLMYVESKACYCLILMIIVPVILEIDLILHLWLGEAVPRYANIFTILVLVDALIHTLNTPLSQVAYADGKIKNFQLATAIVNISFLPCCWILFKMGYDSISSFYAMIAFSCIFQIVSIIYLHEIFAFSYKKYFQTVIWPCTKITLLAPILPLILSLSFNNNSIYEIIIITLVDIVCVAILFYYLCLEKTLRDKVKNYLLMKLHVK